jgi:hypothetical protein
MNISAINKILAGFIIAMCVVLSGFLLFTDLMAESIHGTKRTVFVVILLAYGAYRGYRLYRTTKDQEEE